MNRMHQAKTNLTPAFVFTLIPHRFLSFKHLCIRPCRTRQKSGFTLLEVLLSVAVITLISGIFLVVYQAFQVRNDLDIAATTYVHTLRRAQILSQAVDGDMPWGVYIVSGNITLFRGTSYITRESSLDEIFDLPASITPSGISEIVFNKLSGLPQITGSVTLTSNTNETNIITINSKGTIEY